MARKHWAEWLPEKTAELKAEGRFAEETMASAKAAQKEIQNLMKRGYQEHEAEEVVLPQLILLEPEEVDDELAQEEREAEAEYYRMVGRFFRYLCHAPALDRATHWS